MSRRVLVVGGDGFIGRAIVADLVARGDRVVAMSRETVTTWSPGSTTSTRAPDTLRSELDACDCVVWTAGATTPGVSAGKPVFEVDATLSPLAELLELMSGSRRKPLLFISSGGTVYGNAVGQSPLPTTTPLSPASYYGAGKAASEMFVRAWASQTEGSAVILRPSNVYGPGQRGKPTFGIVPAAMTALLQGTELVLWGGGAAVRDYLYISDFTALARKATLRIAPGIQVLHASSGELASALEIVRMIESLSGRTLRLKLGEPRPVDVPRVALANGDTRAALDWSPAMPLAQGLAETWRWFREMASRPSEPRRPVS